MRELWDQRIDEPDVAYQQFRWWLSQNPRPPPSNPALAHHYDWSTRVRAWDALQSVPAGLAARVEDTVECLVLALNLSARKLAARELTSDESTIPAKEIAQAAKSVTMMLKELRGGKSLADDVDAAKREIEERDLTPTEALVVYKLLSKHTKD